MASAPSPLTVELSVSERNPPVGWIRSDGTQSPFSGWLELIGLLEAIVGGEAGEPAAGRAHDIAGHGRSTDGDDSC